jgi:hypothetical protein
MLGTLVQQGVAGNKSMPVLSSYRSGLEKELGNCSTNSLCTERGSLTDIWISGAKRNHF